MIWDGQVCKCPQYKYLINGICQGCPENCMNCSETGLCLQCKRSYVFVGLTCQKCMDNCISCLNMDRCT
jgi:hypothetical protein